MGVNYDHSKGVHSLLGPQVAIPLLFDNAIPRSLLDVGCGTGTWLKAAQDFGIADIFGVDGVNIPADKLLISSELFRRQDLTKSWNLGRKFEVVLCLEVAEHLPERDASPFINSLTSHADTIFFSAGAPGQDGQGHINCQWPGYWQKKFNENGYVCTDALRWKIWSDNRIEPWYRQNLFIARRDPLRAGREEPIAPVVHPDILQTMFDGIYTDRVNKIEEGGLPMKWYIKSLSRAVLARSRKYR